MIPKTLHYCWFGKNPKSKILQDCLKSWQHYCPEFEIKEWNESNSTQFANSFFKNALRKKKYAFAADYVRTEVLYHQGGIYLDTDMLLLKPINEFEKYTFFIGEEVPGRIAFGLFGATPKHPIFKQMLDFYHVTEFNEFSLPVITHTFSSMVFDKIQNEQEIILPPACFYPLPYGNRNDNYLKFITEETVAIHLWEHSWKSIEEDSTKQLIQNIKTVIIDYLFYNYSYAYFKRYLRGFSRKLYHRFKSV